MKDGKVMMKDGKPHMVDAVRPATGARVACNAEVAKGGAFFDALKADNIKKPAPFNVPNVRDAPLYDFLNNVEQRFFYQYEGSLTRPPCTEGVNWTVYSTPLYISPAHLNGFKAKVTGDVAYSQGKGNAREVQPLNDRSIFFNTGAVANTVSIAVAGLAAILAF